ncbi:hypothetical protein Rhopal_007263-T1 [Rhodotorula paludigena]|uniref:CRIB domain-containing protein n=1 Tax=Rhodotorula paludigena TaxID=86838 RepID=A0AAV5GYD8_9BASI|nr:hypothetical protein Rhopal_007263-T1 [Rhodotorula paludigena]
MRTPLDTNALPSDLAARFAALRAPPAAPAPPAATSPTSRGATSADDELTRRLAGLSAPSKENVERGIKVEISALGLARSHEHDEADAEVERFLREQEAAERSKSDKTPDESDHELIQAVLSAKTPDREPSLPALSPSLLDTLSGVEVQFFRPSLAPDPLPLGLAGGGGEEDELMRRAWDEVGVEDTVRKREEQATDRWAARMAELEGVVPSAGGVATGSAPPRVLEEGRPDVDDLEKALRRRERRRSRKAGRTGSDEEVDEDSEEKTSSEEESESEDEDGRSGGSGPDWCARPSPFNCFGASGYDATLPRHTQVPANPSAAGETTTRRHPYSTAALPPLQPSPPRSPSKRATKLVGVRKQRIGSPTGFRHLGHVGPDGARGVEREMTQIPPTTFERLSSVLTRSPSLPSSSSRTFASSQRLPSASAPPTPLLPLDYETDAPRTHSSSRLSPPIPSTAQDRHRSLPPSSLLSTSSPALSSSQTDIGLSSPPSRPPRAPARRASLQHPPTSSSAPGPVKRKPPPAITASVIRQAGGVEAVQQSGGVPSAFIRAQPVGLGAATEPGTGRGRGSVLALQELFTPSELRAIDAAVGAAAEEEGEGGSGAEEEGEVGEKAGEGYETNTTKAFRGAMREVEEALRREAQRERGGEAASDGERVQLR